MRRSASILSTVGYILGFGLALIFLFATAGTLLVAIFGSNQNPEYQTFAQILATVFGILTVLEMFSLIFASIGRAKILNDPSSPKAWVYLLVAGILGHNPPLIIASIFYHITRAKE